MKANFHFSANKQCIQIKQKNSSVLTRSLEPVAHRKKQTTNQSLPWTSSQRASQKIDQYQHFQHLLIVVHQKLHQNLLYPCLSQLVESLDQVHGILR